MLEEKIEALTAETVKLRQAVEANTEALGGAAASEDAPAKKAPAKKAPAKKAAAKKVTPKHDADEVGAILRQAAKEVDKKQVQEYIAGVDCEDLAELLTKPELFDAAYDFAKEMIGEEAEEEDEEEDI